MLTTKSVCELCGLRPSTLNEWVSKGHVAPARLGGVGRGNSHRFSARQVLGLAIVAALHHSWRGCSPQYASKVVRMFEDMDDESLSNWLAHSGDVGPSPEWMDPHAPNLPGDEYIEEDMSVRLARVEPVVRALMADEAVPEPPTPQPCKLEARSRRSAARQQMR